MDEYTFLNHHSNIVLMQKGFITKGVYEHLEDVMEREHEIHINVGTIGHCDYGDKQIMIDTTMKHDWYNGLVMTQDTIDHIKGLKDYFTYDYQNECKGDFNKVTKGNRHTYPHWHKEKY